MGAGVHNRIKLRGIVEVLLRSNERHHQGIIDKAVQMFPQTSRWTIKDASDEQILHFLSMFPGCNENTPANVVYSSLIQNFKPFIDHVELIKKAATELTKWPDIDYVEIKMVMKDGQTYAARVKK